MAVRVTGIDDILRELEKVEGKMARKALRKSLLAGARVIRDEAMRLAPRGATENLADDMQAEMIRYSKTDAMAGVGPHRKRFYGKYQEFGTSHNAAQPFLRPALDNKGEEALDVIAETMRKELGL